MDVRVGTVSLRAENVAINAVQMCIYENEVQTRRPISVEFTATYCPVFDIKLVYVPTYPIIAIDTCLHLSNVNRFDTILL